MKMDPKRLQDVNGENGFFVGAESERLKAHH